MNLQEAMPQQHEVRVATGRPRRRETGWVEICLGLEVWGQGIASSQQLRVLQSLQG